MPHKPRRSRNTRSAKPARLPRPQSNRATRRPMPGAGQTVPCRTNPGGPNTHTNRPLPRRIKPACAMTPCPVHPYLVGRRRVPSIQESVPGELPPVAAIRGPARVRRRRRLNDQGPIHCVTPPQRAAVLRTNPGGRAIRDPPTGSVPRAIKPRHDAIDAVSRPSVWVHRPRRQGGHHAWL